MSHLSFLDQKPFLGTYANSVDPVQMQQNAASNQGQHCILTEIYMKIQEKKKKKKKRKENPPEPPKTGTGLIQILRLYKYAGQNRLNSGNNRDQ